MGPRGWAAMVVGRGQPHWFTGDLLGGPSNHGGGDRRGVSDLDGRPWRQMVKAALVGLGVM
jgi:hypothetical protein